MLLSAFHREVTRQLTNAGYDSTPVIARKSGARGFEAHISLLGDHDYRIACGLSTPLHTVAGMWCPEVVRQEAYSPAIGAFTVLIVRFGASNFEN